VKALSAQLESDLAELVRYVKGYIDRCNSIEPITGADLSQSPAVLVVQLAKFLNSEASNFVNLSLVCQPHDVPAELDEAVHTLPLIITDTAQLMQNDDPSFGPTITATLRSVLFLRRCVLPRVPTATVAQFVPLLNVFNQVTIDLLGYKLVRDRAKCEEKLRAFNSALGELHKFLKSQLKK